MNLKKGSTIIEVLIAATLISTAILAALSLSSTSQKQTDFSRHLSQATTYNNQAIDWLRNMRTRMGWAEFVNNHTTDSTATYCINSLPVTTEEYLALSGTACGSADFIAGTNFQREMVISYQGDPITSTNVVVTTYWDDKARSISEETILTSW